MAKAHFLSILGASLLALTGCMPERVVIDLKPPPRELEETAVPVDGETPADAGGKIALIDVRGLLADVRAPALIGSGPNPVDELAARLHKAGADPGVKAVILRINSPGGTVAGSETMYREVRRFRERTNKPVVACMSEVCASGGFYLALAADEIIALPTTVTASIGVIIQTFNFSGGMAKFGIEGRSVTSGPNKAMGSPFEPAKEQHYALLQGLVDEFYARFRGLARERRPGVSDNDFARVTDGRVITGAEAARIGLVDKAGDLRDAYAAATRLSGAGGARLVKYHTRGDAPRTAFAVNAPIDPAQPGALFSHETNVSLLNVAAAMGAPIEPGFYYLWTPLAP